MIAEYFPETNYSDIMSSHYEREKALEKGMYAFVSWEWVNPLSEWLDESRCLEVMAGRGWLTYALRQKGMNVIATDDYSWHTKMKWGEPVTPVEKLDAVGSVQMYGKAIDVLIMSWPYMDSTAHDTIKTLHEVNPDAVVVYIGESYGGCTADDSFFEHFERIKNDVYFNAASNRFSSFRGINDQLMLGRYKF